MNKFKLFFIDYIIPFLGKVFIFKNKYVNVIYFHDIVEGEGFSLMKMNEIKFKELMRHVKDTGYDTLRFDDFADPEQFLFNKKRIVIAFDDGWESNYSLIFHWMKEMGIKYNIFLTICEIGTNPEYLSWEQIREMHMSGVCGFGIHSYSHPDMSDVTKIDLEVEICKADQRFKSELGYSPLDFCYPFGYYSEASNRWLTQNTLYKRIYTSGSFFSYKQDNSFIMSRQGISNDDSMNAFRNKINGYQNVYNAFFSVYYRFFSK